ncbi:hypothetical protein GCM10023115_11050 [Pontixanthobacter gangjinensis]|uniref:Uncharacterized protein n=1 Tax=Pontixanthobacter gangjinensis TaxID=1028742 RepID=A0A6I4SKF9_9SPHN|nr:hypothetical protein [Pontixanthobacter gangjinensis]MXO56351.1 hypothetical protein [Pontixanthobacter gangjinensis]
MTKAPDNGPSEEEALARNRFFMLSMVRLVGAIAVMTGLLIANGTAGAPVWIGYILLAAGMAGFFIFPLLLAKRWRTPD